VALHDLILPAAEGCKPLVSNQSTSTATSSPVQLINIGNDPSKPALSILIINTEAPLEKQTRLAHEAVSVLPSGCSVGLLAAVPLQSSSSSTASETGGLRAVLLGGLAEAPGALPVGKGDIQVYDGLVAALAHFLHASQIPTCCVIVPGAPGASSAADSAQPWGGDARLLGDAASLVFPSAGILFSPSVASTCRAEYILGRRSEQDLGGGDLMYV